MMDVAFTVEGPYEKYDQIPYEVLVAGLEKRLNYLKSRGPEELDAFGHCDTYEVE